jgi:hypothetical protein
LKSVNSSAVSENESVVCENSSFCTPRFITEFGNFQDGFYNSIKSRCIFKRFVAKRINLLPE